MDFSRIKIKNLVFSVKDAIARNLASAADRKADSAAANASIALTAAQEAEISANAADAKADNAVAVATAIDSKATQALSAANSANANATQAVNTANTANATANSADAKATRALEDIPTKVSDLSNDSGFVNSTQAANAAPVQSVVNKTGDVTLANIMGNVPASGATTSYPTDCGRYAVTANIFSHITPVSYTGVLTIERKDSYQRHTFTSAQGDVYVGWVESWDVTEPTRWFRVPNYDYYVTQEYEISENVSAGTIGTRGALINVSCSKTGYRIIDAWVTYVNGSANGNVSIFQQANSQSVYVAIYRATASAFTYGCKFSILYQKN